MNTPSLLILATAALLLSSCSSPRNTGGTDTANALKAMENTARRAKNTDFGNGTTHHASGSASSMDGALRGMATQQR